MLKVAKIFKLKIKFALQDTAEISPLKEVLKWLYE